MAGFIDAAVLRVLVDVNNSKANAELGRTQKALKATAGIAKASLAAMAVAAPAAAGAMVKLASDAEEVESKFKIVFGKEAPNAVRQLDRFSKATGTSRYELRRQAADFQALIRPMGLSTKNASDMSVGMTKLATDLASFNNTSVEDAMVALRSGLVGESEPLRRFGVQLSAARVQTYAYAKGIARQGAELTAAQKAQATYALILEDTKLAQGDAVRTAGSFANQFKRLKSGVIDAATSIGTSLLPAATAVVEWLNGMPARIDRVTAFLDRHKTVFMAVGAAVGAVAGVYLAMAARALPAHSRALALNAKAWLLANRAMLANPAVRVAVMLGALAAALVAAYRESDTFRRIVDKAFTIVRRVAGTVLGWIVPAVRQAWRAIRTVTDTVWGAVGRAITSAIREAWRVVEQVTGTMSRAVGDAWRAIRTVARDVWGQIKDRIVDPIRDARDDIDKVWEQIKTRAGDAWEALRNGARDFGKEIKDKIVGAFKGAADKVRNFAVGILRVVDKIPGVNLTGTIKGLQAQKFARGGAYARTGGVVRHPITLMGEEAPRHPEFVIPTNPAYRGRARGLLAQAAGAIGFARGGVYGQPELEDLWKRVGGPPGIARLASAVALAESGGNANATNRNSNGTIDRGLWQINSIHGALSTYDPVGNARAALSISGGGRNWRPWVAFNNGNYNRFMGGGARGQSITGAIGGIMGKLMEHGAGFLLKQLPGIGGLPDWLKGTGKHMLGQAGSFIKDKVKSVIGGGLGGGAGGLADVTKWAHALGLVTTSGYRPGDPGYHGLNRARDYAFPGAYGPHPKQEQFALMVARALGSRLKELIYTPLGWSIKNGQKVPPYAQAGHYNHVHVAMARGGMFGGPFVGAYKNGGTVPQDGMAYVHKGERITPAGQSGSVIIQGDLIVQDRQHVDVLAARLAWLTETAV